MSSNFKNVKKILIPIDGSDYSMRAAEYGLGIAKMIDAQIMVVYVMDQTLLDQVLRVADREDVERDLKKDGQQYINYVLKVAQKESVKAGSLLVKGRPFEQIVHLAKELNMDLIVMGTSG